MEKFVDIEGYEGKYQVSNYGNVKSLAKDVFVGNGGVRHQEEKLLKPRPYRTGYLYVRLYKDRKAKNKTIHQLVAQAFLPNPHGYTQVNHKDEDKTNNTVWINDDGSVDLEKSNLEWCTAAYNNNYGTRTERTSKKVYQRTLNRILVKTWPSTAECGRNGFSSGAVSDCCNNKYIREGNNVYKDYIWSYE